MRPSLLLSNVMVSSPSGIASFSFGSRGGGACSKSVFDDELTLPAVYPPLFSSSKAMVAINKGWRCGLVLRRL